MAEQLLLPGVEPPKPLTDRLFFALRPDAAAAASIATLAKALKAEHGLRGRLLPVERLHVTLQFFGDHVGLPGLLLQAAGDAAGELRFPTFDVTFDRVMSFRASGRQKPFVLRGTDQGLATLHALRRTLDLVLARRGMARLYDLKFTPHVTLMYGDRMVAEQPVSPITWRVKELLLIDSLIGLGRHVAMGRWPLDD